MAGIFTKRFFRYCRNNIFMFLALMVLVTAVVAVALAIECTAYTIIDGRAENAETDCIEDGQFSTLFRLSDEEVKQLSADYDVLIQENFSVDIESNGVTYRIFKPREKIDALTLDVGSAPESAGDLVIDQLFASDNGVELGEKITLDGREYTICGIGSIPDYLQPTKTLSDAGNSTDSFTWVMVSAEKFDSLLASTDKTVEYTYAFIMEGTKSVSSLSRAVNKIRLTEEQIQNGDDALKEFVDTLPDRFYRSLIPNAMSFVKREDNRRMDNEIRFAKLYRTGGFIVGSMLVVMMALIFAVVTKNQIHDEHCEIGSLYALGVHKRTIMMFYITPTLIITLIGGIIGLILGFTPDIVNIAVGTFHRTYSYPYYELSHPAILFVYAIVMPPVLSFIVNVIMLNGSLSKPVLSLIRGTYEKKSGGSVKLKGRSFIGNFQIRRLFADKSALIVFVCVFFSVAFFMLGLTEKYVAVNNEKAAIKNTSYDYICTVKYPLPNLETSGEKVYIETVKTGLFSKNINFSLVGVQENSDFYDIGRTLGDKEAVAGRAIATKLGLKVGDKLQFRECISEQKHTVTIVDIIDSGASLELYVDIDYARSVFDRMDTYYNAVLFRGEPDIDSGLIYSVTTKESTVTAISTMQYALKAFVIFSYTASIIIFISTIYLIISTMIDRCTMGVSLIRVFGYTTWEIQRMYVNPMIYAVVASLILVMPAAKIACDAVNPYFLADLPMGMFVELPLKLYVEIFAAALVIFFLILLVLMRKIGRISTNEILKERE